MKLIPLALALGALTLLPANPTWARKWNTTTGTRSIDAEFVEVKGDNLILQRASGSRVSVPTARLSQADRDYLASIGHPIFAPPLAPAADAQICAVLKQVQQIADVPAMAGAIVTSKGLVAFGVAGVRKRGTNILAAPSDLWHLGSDTKAMTAMLAARLVEQGKLRWDSTLAEIFADEAATIPADLQNVTLLQLLSHRSGLAPNLNLVDYLGADGRAERVRAVRQELAKPPHSKPGSEFEYSNLGYIIAGAIIEKVTDKSWEASIAEQVFNPLEMKSAGFGGTGSRSKVDQPWPHTSDGQPTAENGSKIDNPPVMGPAGRVHCTIQDWSKFAADMLRGTTGQPALLPGDAYKKLTTAPFGGDYALGWTVVERDWAGGAALQHNGSNTMNMANIWIAPHRDFAILVCTNQGGDAATAACDAAVVALLGHYQAMQAK